jgi:hypothetical protein
MFFPARSSFTRRHTHTRHTDVDAENLGEAVQATDWLSLSRVSKTSQQTPPPQRGAGHYFFISSSSVLASMCMSIPAHTSLGEFAFG